MADDEPTRGWFDDLADDRADDAPVAPRRALETDTQSAGGTTHTRRSTRRRLGFGALSVAIALVVLLVVVAGYYLIRVNSALDSVKRENFAPTGADRPALPVATGPQQPKTFVLIGSDSRGSADARSDSLMVVYLPSNRQHVYVVSVPRDTYVDIPGYGKAKINAAFSHGQVPLTMQTLENLFHVRMQHAVVVDFNGFIKLTDVLGGITVDNPEESWERAWQTPYHYPKGRITIRGQEALAYVRQRHELKDGDLGRALRQRLVIKGIITKALSMGVLANPATFGTLLDEVSKIVTVDNELTSDLIRTTVLSMRISSGEDVRGLQIPLSGFQMHPKAGAIDVLDEARMAKLAEAMQHDTMDAYYEAHKDEALVGPGTRPTSALTPGATSTKKK